MRRYALLLSGGTGSRIGGDVPKQYLRVKGKMILFYSLETLLFAEEIEGVFLVAAEEWQEEIQEEMRKVKLPSERFQGFALPGGNRQQSIINGMEKMLLKLGAPEEEDLILIHDAARPFLSGEMLRACFCAAEGHDGAMPVLPMKDTVYFSDPGKTRAEKRLDRNRLFAGQAPEVFRLKKYFEANQKLTPSEVQRINGSSEPAIDAGMDIALFPGDERNFKITTEADLERMRMLVK